MRSRRSTALVAATVLAATGLAACGDDEEDTASPPPPPAATQTATTGAEQPAEGGAVEVAADPDGDLAFVQDSLTAPAGSVTFAFTNQANVPHNFIIEQDGDRVDGTEIVTQGEEDVTVALEPGSYTYYCSVSNHRDEGMEGELTVE